MRSRGGGKDKDKNGHVQNSDSPAKNVIKAGQEGQRFQNIQLQVIKSQAAKLHYWNHGSLGRVVAVPHDQPQS